MAEQIRSIKVSLVIDTNKRTISYEREVTSLDEAEKLMKEWVYDLEDDFP